jgi:maleylacetoacetate isomerase
MHSATRKRNREPSERVLYNYWRSSCSWRVRICLEFKGLPYQYKAVNLLKGEDCTPEMRSLNPAGVPTLVDENGETLTQSWAIMEYLEEKYPEPALLPRSFEDRAKVRSVALLVVSGIQPLTNLGMLQRVKRMTSEEAKNQYAKDILIESLWGLEEMLKKYSGKFCVGDQFTMADACIPPQVYAAKRFGGEDILKEFPNIQRVHSNIIDLDFVQRTKPEAMPDADPPPAPKPAEAKL